MPKRFKDAAYEDEESPPKRGRPQQDDSDGAASQLYEEDEVEEKDHNDDENKDPSKVIKRPPVEAGILLEIYAENFMCHRKLRVKLGRNVNFINGQNGSGKSAILAAIQICLGASARQTHRAGKLQDLVRKDANCSHAIVHVKLTNQGSDGYKHDVYGDTITVERTIRVGSGFNGFKLKDHTGKERSQEKKDLLEMLDTLNIQVDNPVSVLDQEEAKKFLKGKPEDKYRFFMKATELERIDVMYSATLETVQTLTCNHEKMKSAIANEQEQVDNLRKKVDELQAVEKMEDKLDDLKTKYAWSLYHDFDAAHKTSIKKLESFQERAAKKQVELTQAEQTASQDDQKEQLDARMNELVQEAHEQAELKSELDKALKAAAAPLKALERQLAQLGRQKKDTELHVKAAQQRLQEARDQVLAQTGSAESEHKQNTAKLQKAEEQLASARSKMDELKHAKSEAFRAYEEMMPHVDQAKGQVTYVQSQLKRVHATLQSLQQGSGDEFALLGPRVKSLYVKVEAAKRERKFKGPVVGPIAKFIKIAPGQEEYASIAELAIGVGTLDRFIVTCDEDRKQLQILRRSVGCQRDCEIFQSRVCSRYAVPAPIAGCQTVASVLSISEDLVFNCLVDNTNIDQIALGQSKESTERCLLVTGPNGRPAMKANGGRGIKAVHFLPNGDCWRVNKGSLSMVSNEKKLRKTIGQDKTASIEEAKREEQQLNHELKESKKEEAKLEHEHLAAQKKWNAANRAHKANEDLITKLSNDIDLLKVELESIATSSSVDMKPFEADVADAEEELVKLTDTVNRLKEEVSNCSPEMEGIRRKLDEANLRNQKILQDMENAQEDVLKLTETQTQHDAIVEKKREKLAQYLKIVAGHEKVVEENASDCKQALLKARQMTLHCRKREQAKKSGATFDASTMSGDDDELESIEIVTVEQKPQYYQAKVTRAVSKLEKEKALRKVTDDDPAEALDAYVKARAALSAKTDDLDELKKQVDSLNKDIAKRKKRWRDMRKKLTKNTMADFHTLMRLNGYVGDLAFKHNEGTLELSFQKGLHNTQSQTKDVKALSGGEGSFTTMCLLMALGENLETPFRILDEFDVFLDTANRKLVMNCLIHTARNMEHRQFIFITPQDLSSITVSDFVRIHRLQNPVRDTQGDGPSQQVLPF